MKLFGLEVKEVKVTEGDIKNVSKVVCSIVIVPVAFICVLGRCVALGFALSKAFIDWMVKEEK